MISPKPSVTASAPATPRPGGRADAGVRPRRHPQTPGDRDGRRLRALARRSIAPTAKADLAAGKKIFADTCAVCHGEDGKGKRELGAPNLTDAIWLYGSGKASVIEGVWNGRGGVMPAWAGRLDDVTIKALAVYVHSFGGGEK